MTTYDVYLEINQAGACYAHVPALPGCMVRAADQKTAVTILPHAIRTEIERLVSRGLLDELPEGIELNIVETHQNSGAFDPGDSTALLSVDEPPLTENYLRWFLRHTAENRADLLALVEQLPEEVFDWTGWDGGMSIGEVLRHVGRSEMWYLSRIVGPEGLPDEWSGPELEAVIEFLGMVRKGVVVGFGRLSEAARAMIFQPGLERSHLEEQWTARKALRRLLEHEREHIGHIEAILESWRRHFMVRLTAERSAFLWQLIRLGEETLVEAPIFDNYTAKDLLGHVADWDDFHREWILMAEAGRESEIVSVDMDKRNLVLYEQRKGLTLTEAVEMCMDARRRFEETIVRLPDPVFHRPVQLPWKTTSIRSWSQWRYRHDAAHAEDVAKWLADNQDALTIGPKSLILATMEASHQEMLAVVALIPEEERETRPVCGVWTLKDVLGHVADWEWFGVEKWRPEQSNRSLQIPYPGSIQKWNELHAAARKDDSWERVWVDFTNARAALRQIVEGFDERELAREIEAPWNPDYTIYRWLIVWGHHERDHAADLRKVLNLPDFPERLTHV